LPFDFPNNPPIGTTVTGSQGELYYWDGVKWTSVAGTGSVTNGGTYVGDVAPSPPNPGQFWFNSIDTQLYVWYVDPTSSEWVVANNFGASGSYVPINGTTMSGPLILYADPTAPLGAATKQYADNRLHSIGYASAYDFGVLFNGTDETSNFQTYLNYCRDNQLDWFLPKTLTADGLTFYTSGRAAPGAQILATNNGQSTQVVTIQYLAADLLTVASGEYSGWSDLYRGSPQITGLSGRRGQYVYITQSDALIGRYGSTAFTQQLGFTVWSDAGDIYPPIGDTLTWPGTGTAVTAQVMRSQITIENLVVVMSDPPGGNTGGERNRVVTINRANVTMRGCQILSNCATVGIQQGFVCTNTTNVQFERCVVDNIRGSGTTNYGFNNGGSNFISYIDCQTRKTRRGIDAQSGNMIRVRGGSFDGGIGAHWGHDIDVDGALVALNYSGGSDRALWFSGGNCRVRNCTITLTGSALGVMGLRSDLYEMYGLFELSGCKIVIDNTGSSIGASAVVELMNLSGPSAGSVYDTLRAVTLPSEIRIVGNRVSYLGPNTATLSVLSLCNDWTSAQFNQQLTLEGTVAIHDNVFDLQNGLTDGAGNPRLTMTAIRPQSQVGGGYRMRIKGMPCFYYYALADSLAVNNASRHQLRVEDVSGPLRLSQSAGMFSRAAMLNCLGTITVGIPTGGAGYTPVGDEVIFSRDDLNLQHTYYTIAGVAQPAFILSNLGAGAYFQLSNGASGIVMQAQGPTNASVNIVSRGSGFLNLGTASAPMTITSSTYTLNGTNIILNGSGTGVTIGASGAPNIRSGTGVATGTQPAGSLFLRTDGAVGTRLYVSAGAGTWNAVAGV